jgi:hypothetical protein
MTMPNTIKYIQLSKKFFFVQRIYSLSKEFIHCPKNFSKNQEFSKKFRTNFLDIESIILLLKGI